MNVRDFMHGLCQADIDDGHGNLCVRASGHVGRHMDNVVDAERQDIRNDEIEACAQIAHDIARNVIGLDGPKLAELIADTIRERRT